MSLESLPLLPRIVLDTNVVLDWMLFADPGCAGLSQALRGRQLIWLATAAMQDELTHVLQRGHLDPWKPDVAGIVSHWQRHCLEVSAPSTTDIPSGRLRCSDPADQMFIDLAVAQRVDWLISRDRAVLKLRRRLLPLGIRVATPAEWQATAPQAKERATEVAL